MVCDPTPSRAMLPHPLDLHIPGPLEFSRARSRADQAAREILPEPVLLAWFNRDNREFSPRIVCCQEDQPSWLVYAKSRGAELSLCLNDGQFIFVYRRGF